MEADTIALGVRLNGEPQRGGMLLFKPTFSGNYHLYLGSRAAQLTVRSSLSEVLNPSCTTAVTSSECSVLRGASTYALDANVTYAIEIRAQDDLRYVRMFIQRAVAQVATCEPGELETLSDACSAAASSTRLALPASNDSPLFSGPPINLDTTYTMALASVGSGTYAGEFSYVPPADGDYELFLGTPKVPLIVHASGVPVVPECSRPIPSSECGPLRRGERLPLEGGKRYRFRLGPYANTAFVRVALRKAPLPVCGGGSSACTDVGACSDVLPPADAPPSTPAIPFGAPGDFTAFAPSAVTSQPVVGVPAISAVVPNGDAVGDVFLSYTGRFMTFASEASNLLGCDSNDVSDVFIYDRQNGSTRRVSVGPSGEQLTERSLPVAASDDGCTVAFASFATANTSIGSLNVWSCSTGRSVRVRDSMVLPSFYGDEIQRGKVALSEDGRLLAFPGGLVDLTTGTSLAAGTGTDAPLTISRDGRELLYTLYDGSAEDGLLSVALPDGAATQVWDQNFDYDISSFYFITDRSRSGRVFAFDAAFEPISQSETRYAFLADRNTGELLEFENTPADELGDNCPGDEGAAYRTFHPRLSADGSRLAHLSCHGVSIIDLAAHTRHTYVWDGASPDIRAAQPRSIALSGDGRHVVFSTRGDIAGDVRPGGRDLFVLDLE